jgi:hypothetical protein
VSRCEHVPIADEAQFLDDDPARSVQLRPRLHREQGPFFPYVGTRVLVCRSSEPGLRAFLDLPAEHHANTPANVEIALQRLESFDPAYAQIFREEIANSAAATSVSPKA